MADILHSAIADADRHEAKGASSATSGTVLFANGDGTTEFRLVNYGDLGTKPVAGGYAPVLYGYSTATSQNPSAQGVAMQVEFGTSQTTTDVTLATDGTLTFNTAGYFMVTVFYRFGRTSSSGTSIMFNRMLYNGAQLRNSNSIYMSDATDVFPYSYSYPVVAAIGDVLTFQILRDTSGSDYGGLMQASPSLSGWNVAPTASILVSKLQALS